MNFLLRLFLKDKLLFLPADIRLKAKVLIPEMLGIGPGALFVL
jgi:hypothetical protein